MEEKNYPFSLTRNESCYQFLSVSAKKEVKKEVIFTEIESPNIFNLALVDVLDNGDVSDTIETKNDDMITVMATVIKIIDDFLNKNKNSFVTFRGSNEVRQRLYRIIIGRELSKIVEYFEVFGGMDNGDISKFEINKHYDFYVIKQKNENIVK